MLDSRSRLVIAILLVVIFALVAAIFWMANGRASEDHVAEQAEIQTAAVDAFITQLTASAPPPSPTPRLLPSPSKIAPAPGSGTPSCLGLHFVRDVTVPDNTEVTPAQVFTKSWQVENSGTCAWKPGFQVVLIGGVAMGGSPFKVAQTVGPGGSIQISIKMAAPTNQTGVVQGTWKMSDETGATFGDFLSVVVVVKGRGSTPNTPVITVTP